MSRMVRSGVHARRRKRTSILAVTFLVILLLAVGAGVVWFGLNYLRSSFSTPGILPGLPNGDGPSENVDYAFGQVVPSWTGKERITVLLMGIDERSQESGPWRTDTMMVLTLDPLTLNAGVMSIPRDLWVPIPGYNDGRINTAHFLGDLYGFEGGGPALAVDAVEYNFGIKIDYYVRVNFQAFVTVVDQIGGIDINVEDTINDPTYPDHAYGYDPLYIEQGEHHFDGELALKYARTRHGSSDFDRAKRQQQVLLAVLDRVTSLELLPQLARNAPELFTTLSDSVATDLALDQMMAMGKLALDVERDTIRFGIIDQSCTQSWVTPNGAQVLIPIRDRMREVRDYIMFVDIVDTTSGSGTGIETMPTPTPEIATLAVLNGTGRPGLAGRTADILKANNIEVAQVGNAERQDVASSMVIVYRDKPVTLSHVLNRLNLSPTSVVASPDATAAYDIVIVLGADFPEPSTEE